MIDKWNLCVLRPQSLMSFSYQSRDQAFLAAYDLEGDGHESALYIENPRGERIGRREIIGWCHSRFAQMKQKASEDCKST